MIINPNSTTIARPDLGLVVAEYDDSDVIYIADRILPYQPMKLKSDVFNKMKAESLAQVPVTIRETGGSFPRIGKKITTDNYACVEHGLEEPMDQQESAIYGEIIAGEQKSAEFVAGMMKRELEVEIATAIINETNWTPAGATGRTITTPWDDPAATPLADITACGENIRQATGKPRSSLTLEISPYTYANIMKVTEVQNSLKVWNMPTDGLPRLDALAQIWGVKEVIVGNMTYNTANDGLTPVYADVWNPDYAFLFFRMEPGMKVDEKRPGLGLIFTWDFASGTWLVEHYVQDQIASNVVRVRQWRHPKIVNSVYGNLLKNTKT